MNQSLVKKLLILHTKAYTLSISLLTALLTALLLVPVEASENSQCNSAQEVGKRLCDQIDLTKPGLEEVRKSASEGEYAKALDAWRDWKVMQIRRMDPGQFLWHGNQLYKGLLVMAEILTGRIPEQPVPVLRFTHFFSLSGPPDRAIHPDWLAKDPEGHFSVDFSNDYSNFCFATPLAVRYWQSGDPVYLQKWFQITADFACNQKRAVEALDEKTRKTHFCNWSIQAQPALSQGDRVFSMIRSLGVFCKSLPDGEKPKNWDSINMPLEAPLPPTSLALIPPVELAQIAFSLVNDHPIALLERYFKTGAAPNQRRNGLAAVLLTAVTFPEFTASHDLLTKAGEGLNDMVNGAFQIDGGMLEQSFNYNLGDAKSFGQLSALLTSVNPELSSKLLKRQGAFYRTLASLVTPIGKLPAMSSSSPVNPPALWKNYKLLNDWLANGAGSIQGTNDPLCASIAAQVSEQPSLPPPAFTSVAFPYSGYYVQRLDWRWDSPWLFMQASRPGRGHHNMGHNALQVTAYGRPLLVSAGPPVYNPGQLPPESRSDMQAINKLLGEDSSLKVNTVLVDGQSQGVVTPAAVAQTDPISTRWHTSPRFDLMEGYYDLGYSGPNVTHRRIVIFIRDRGFWIVTDIMGNNDGMEHTFTQNWNLPGFQDQGKTLASGFKKDQLEIDPTGKSFHTTDPEGPNLWMNFFGGVERQIVNHFGEKNPYLGWFSPGFGILLPAPQVMVNWKSLSSSVLVTVISPTKTNSQPPFVFRDISENGDQTQSALEIEFQDGSKLVYRAAVTARVLEAVGVSMNAQALLAMKSHDGTVSGLVLGRVGDNPSDFEFRGTDSKIGDIIPIVVPKGFCWRETPQGIQPDYSSR